MLSFRLDAQRPNYTNMLIVRAKQALAPMMVFWKPTPVSKILALSLSPYATHCYRQDFELATEHAKIQRGHILKPVRAHDNAEHICRTGRY